MHQIIQEEQESYTPWPVPRGVVTSTLNSWMYVPLLLNAAGHLPEHDRRTWENHALGGVRWTETCNRFALAPRQPVGVVLGICQQNEGNVPYMITAIQSIISNVRGDDVSLGELVRVLVERNGYLQPRIQEILIQIFGRLHLAREMNQWSDEFRHVVRADATPANDSDNDDGVDCDHNGYTNGRLPEAPTEPAEMSADSTPTNQLRVLRLSCKALAAESAGMLAGIMQFPTPDKRCKIVSMQPSCLKIALSILLAIIYLFAPPTDRPDKDATFLYSSDRRMCQSICLVFPIRLGPAQVT